MARKTERDINVDKVTESNINFDTLILGLEAVKDGLIDKEVLNHFFSSQVPIDLMTRKHLVMHVDQHWRGILEQFRMRILSIPAYKVRQDTIALTQEAVSDGLLSQDVLDHLISLHPQVPSSMKHRYLFSSAVHKVIEEKHGVFLIRASSIKSNSLNFDPDSLELVQAAVKAGLIDTKVLDNLIFLHPKVPLHLQIYKDLKERWYNIRIVFHPSIIPHSRVLDSSVSSLTSTADFPLCPELLSDLNELLVTSAHKWRPLGIALRFQPQDLDVIQACHILIADSPKSYLTRLLEDWVLKKIEYTLLPTSNNLKRALNSQIVGLGKLANDVEKFLRKSAPTSTHLPYSSTNLADLAFPKQEGMLYIEENMSTLIDIRNTSHLERTTFKWLIDGTEFTQNNHISTLCLHKADIDWDSCEFSCEVGAVKTFPVKVYVSCPLDKYRSSLASVYLAQPEVPEDTWPPVSNKKYINLALIKQDTVNYGSEYARLTIRGDIDDILQHKQEIKYEDVYKDLKSRQLLLIEGRPGSGKTTFVHKITHDWATSSNGAIRLVLLVSLRVLNTLNNPNLSDILKLFNDLRVSQDLIEERAGKGVCFIFDGFDEFSPSDGDNSVVHKIINKTYLSQSTVIVASRPAAIAKLRHRADKVIEVIGFLNDQILEYFDYYPFSSKTKPKELKSYLSSHPNILHMCYLPIHAAMVAFIFEVAGKVPKTETEIYELFTRFTLKRNLSKRRDIDVSDIDLHCLNEEEQLCFNHICHIAFEKTIWSKQVLHQDDIKSHFQVRKDLDFSLGLLTIDRTADLYGFKDIYTFLHLTFQEYLAAYHISKLSDDQQCKLIEEHGSKNHMQVVWKFYFGMIKIKAFENKFKSILQQTKENTLHHFQCAYESQQQIVCAQLLKAVHYHIYQADKFLSTPDYTAIGYVVNTTVLSTRLTLINCEVDIAAIDALLSEIKEQARTSLHGLHNRD